MFIKPLQKKYQFNLWVHSEFAVCFSKLAIIRICITYSVKVIKNVKVLAQFCLDNKYKKCKAYKFLILIISNKLSLKICFGVKLFENLIVTHFYNFKKLVGIKALKVKISLITWDSVHPLVHGVLWLCVWLTGVVWWQRFTPRHGCHGCFSLWSGDPGWPQHHSHGGSRCVAPYVNS